MDRQIRQLPAVEDRVETGPTQFGDDWPGVFIRGDNAGWWAMNLHGLLEAAREEHPHFVFQLSGLAEALSSSRI